MLILCYWHYILLLMLLRKSMHKSKHQYKNKNDDIMKTTNTFVVAAPHHRPRRPRRETSSSPSSHYFFGWAFLATIFCRPPFFAAGEGLGEGDTAFLPFFLCTGGGVLWTDVFQERPLLAAGGGEAGATGLFFRPPALRAAFSSSSSSSSLPLESAEGEPSDPFSSVELWNELWNMLWNELWNMLWNELWNIPKYSKSFSRPPLSMRSIVRPANWVNSVSSSSKILPDCRRVFGCSCSASVRTSKQFWQLLRLLIPTIHLR